MTKSQSSNNNQYPITNIQKLSLVIGAWLSIILNSDSYPLAYADDKVSSDVPVVTLTECVRYALANNPKLKQALSAVDIDKSKVTETRSDYLPKITSAASYANASKTAGFIAAGGLAVEGDTYTAQTTLEQLIWDFGKTLDKMRLAGENLNAAELALLQVRQDTIFRTKEAYYETLKAQLSVDISLEQLEQAEIHHQKAEGFYDAGLAPEIDVIKAQSLISNAVLDYVKANKDYGVANAVLNNVTGRAGNTNYRVDEITVFKPMGVSLNEAQGLARQRRASVLKKEQDIKIAKTDLALTKKENIPKLTLDTSYGARDTATTGSVDSWNLGVLFKWPWFDSFKTRSQIEAKEADLKIAQDALRAETLSTALEVQDAVYSLKEKEERINLADKLVNEATENLEVVESKFKEGLGSAVDLSSARASALCAKKRLSIAIADYLIAQAKYRRAIGITQ